MNAKVIYVNDKGYITSIKSGFISAGGQIKKYIKNIKNIWIKKMFTGRAATHCKFTCSLQFYVLF